VSWEGKSITVRPKHGWAPNTVYRIELMPGLKDLRGNADKSNASITISTGSELPSRYISGRVIDWAANRGSAGALVQFIHLPDNATYRALADSTGRFRVGPLPQGDYVVEGVLQGGDQYHRRTKQPWDSVHVGVGQDTTGEIWAFARDTNPPKSTNTERR